MIASDARDIDFFLDNEKNWLIHATRLLWSDYFITVLDISSTFDVG